MHLKRILCPIDFSKFNSAANEYASHLAGSTGASIIYLHVDLPDVYETPPAYLDFDKATRTLARKLEEFVKPHGRNVDVSYVVDFGLPTDCIADYANKNQIDLIVIGTHGRTGLGRVLMGSVAEAVVRKAKCPVLALKCDTKAPVDSGCSENLGCEQNNGNSKEKSRVLCAVDVNDFDQDVVELAAYFAKQFDADLDVLHVTLSPEPTKAAWPAYIGAPSEIVRDHRRLRLIESGVKGVDVNSHQLIGFPVQKVIEFVENYQPKFLVMGTHARSGIHRILGSIAAKIMRRVSCPVVLAKQYRNSQKFMSSENVSDQQL